MLIDLVDLHLIDHLLDDGTSGVEDIQVAIQKNEPELELVGNVDRAKFVFLSSIIGALLEIFIGIVDKEVRVVRLDGMVATVGDELSPRLDSNVVEVHDSLFRVLFRVDRSGALFQS